MKKSRDPVTDPERKRNSDFRNPSLCPDCGKPMLTITYTIWGTKRFDPQTSSYREDDSPGNTDMEFTCPNCSARIDPEGIIF